jgi:hypothetical protein
MRAVGWLWQRLSGFGRVFDATARRSGPQPQPRFDERKTNVSGVEWRTGQSVCNGAHDVQPKVPNSRH